jgi:hypothetical protein
MSVKGQTGRDRPGAATAVAIDASFGGALGGDLPRPRLRGGEGPTQTVWAFPGTADLGGSEAAIAVPESQPRTALETMLGGVSSRRRSATRAVALLTSASRAPGGVPARRRPRPGAGLPPQATGADVRVRSAFLFRQGGYGDAQWRRGSD